MDDETLIIHHSFTLLLEAWCERCDVVFSANTTNVRLKGGNSSREGRLEVYHYGQWGTVCDDSFDDTDARVACFSLGFGFVNSVPDCSTICHFMIIILCLRLMNVSQSHR